MDDTKVFEYIMAWKDKLPADSLPLLQDELKKMPNDKVVNLSQVKLKDPIIGLILGFFLGIFAADRFYQGRIGLGIVKLLVLWILMCLAGIFTAGVIEYAAKYAAGSISYEDSIAYDIEIIMCLILYLLFGLFIMTDWYLVWKEIKQDNLTKINNQLSWIK